MPGDDRIKAYFGGVGLGNLTSYAGNVRAYPKSIVLGRGDALFPIDPANTDDLAEKIRATILHAEKRAYEAGRADTMRDVRRAIGL